MSLLEGVRSGKIRRLRVFADDFTGAAATAVRFSTQGASTKLVAWGGDRCSKTTVTVLDTGTRGLPIAQAVDRIVALVTEVEDDTLIVLRVDSRLRGHCSSELSALRAVVERRVGPVRAVLAPAFPAAGATTRNGRQWRVDAATRDVVPSAPDALAAHFGIQARTLHPHDELCRISATEDVVIDASGEADLVTAAHRIAAAPGYPWIVVDSGSFAPLLARESGLAPGPSQVLVVRGSREQRSRDQVTKASEVLGGHRICVDPDAVQLSIARIIDFIATGAGLVIIEPISTVSQDEDGVAGALAMAAEAAVTLGIRRMVIVGGHTAAAVLARLQVGELHPVLEPFPLGALSRAADGPHGELLILTKGGLVGHDDVVVEAVALLSGYEADSALAATALNSLDFNRPDSPVFP